MADHTSAEIFGLLFKYVAESEYLTKGRVADKLWKLAKNYDFSPDQMNANQALSLLGWNPIDYTRFVTDFIGRIQASEMFGLVGEYANQNDLIIALIERDRGSKDVKLLESAKRNLQQLFPEYEITFKKKEQ
jgi:hypothetical protein